MKHIKSWFVLSGIRTVVQRIFSMLNQVNGDFLYTIVQLILFLKLKKNNPSCINIVAVVLQGDADYIILQKKHWPSFKSRWEANWFQTVLNMLKLYLSIIFLEQ